MGVSKWQIVLVEQVDKVELVVNMWDRGNRLQLNYLL